MSRSAAVGMEPNPINLVEYVRRSPHGSVLFAESVMRHVLPLNTIATAMGIHVRIGIEDNLWRKKGEKMTSVQQIEQAVRIAKELGRTDRHAGAGQDDPQDRHLV